MVGRSGKVAARVAPPDASGLSLPERMCGIDCTIEPTVMCAWPPMTSIIAGKPPLYKTTMKSQPERLRNSAVPKCWNPPAVAIVMVPGLLFAMAITSLTVVTGSEGPTVSTVGPVPSMATQSNARSGSYGSLRTAGFMVKAAEAMSSV